MAAPGASRITRETMDSLSWRSTSSAAPLPGFFTDFTLKTRPSLAFSPPVRGEGAGRDGPAPGVSAFDPRATTGPSVRVAGPSTPPTITVTEPAKQWTDAGAVPVTRPARGVSHAPSRARAGRRGLGPGPCSPARPG